MTAHLETRLKKSKISLERFNNDKRKLAEKGFSDQDCNKIIIRQSNANTIQSLIANADDLLREFNHKQIVKIAAHNGGANNIQAVKEAFKELKNLGLDTAQVVKIVAHEGGAKNIQAVQETFKELKDLGFNTPQIVKIAGNIRGSKNIQAVKDAFKELKALGFNVAQIVRIAAHDGGAKNIQTVQETFKELKSLGFNAEQLVRIAARGGGSKNIQAVKNAFKDLKAFGLDATQIVKIAAHDGGSKNIKAVRDACNIFLPTAKNNILSSRFAALHNTKFLWLNEFFAHLNLNQVSETVNNPGRPLLNSETLATEQYFAEIQQSIEAVYSVSAFEELIELIVADNEAVVQPTSPLPHQPQSISTTPMYNNYTGQTNRAESDELAAKPKRQKFGCQ